MDLRRHPSYPRNTLQCQNGTPLDPFRALLKKKRQGCNANRRKGARGRKCAALPRRHGNKPTRQRFPQRKNVGVFGHRQIADARAVCAQARPKDKGEHIGASNRRMRASPSKGQGRAHRRFRCKRQRRSLNKNQERISRIALYAIILEIKTGRKVPQRGRNAHLPCRGNGWERRVLRLNRRFYEMSRGNRFPEQCGKAL